MGKGEGGREREGEDDDLLVCILKTPYLCPRKVCKASTSTNRDLKEERRGNGEERKGMREGREEEGRK